MEFKEFLFDIFLIIRLFFLNIYYYIEIIFFNFVFPKIKSSRDIKGNVVLITGAGKTQEMKLIYFIIFLVRIFLI